MRPFVRRREERIVSGWRRQGLGLFFNESLKRSDVSVGLTAMPKREITVSGGLVQKAMVRVAAGASALVAMLLAGGASRWK
jgi:hypothetical protein